MALANLLKSNFGSGELSPQMEGRPDLSVFATGSRVLDNFFLTRTAGVVVRDGFELVQEIDDGAFNVEEARLIPMQRPEGAFSLLLVGWQEVGVDYQQIGVMKEYPVDGRALITDRKKAYLTDVSSVPNVPTPAVPSNLRVIEGLAVLVWAWDSAAHANGYEIQVKQQGARNWRPAVTVAENRPYPRYDFKPAVIHRDPTGSETNVYEARVRSISLHNIASAWTVAVVGEAGLKLGAPTDVTAVQESGNEITVRWKRTDDTHVFFSFIDALLQVHYELEFRRQGATAWGTYINPDNQFGLFPTTIATFEPELRADTLEVRITARFEYSEFDDLTSDPSEIATVDFVPDLSPSPPEDVTSDTVTHPGRIRYLWVRPEGDVDRYEWRARRPGVNWGADEGAASGFTTATPVVVPPFAGSLRIQFQVRTLNSSGIPSAWAPERALQDDVSA